MNKELKPCPFCGGEAATIVREFTDDKADYGHAHIGCMGCGVEQPYKRSKAEAISAWNTRPSQDTPMTTEIDRVIERLRSFWNLGPGQGGPASDLMIEAAGQLELLKPMLAERERLREALEQARSWFNDEDVSGFGDNELRVFRKLLSIMDAALTQTGASPSQDTP